MKCVPEDLHMLIPDVEIHVFIKVRGFIDTVLPPVLPAKASELKADTKGFHAYFWYKHT